MSRLRNWLGVRIFRHQNSGGAEVNAEVCRNSGPGIAKKLLGLMSRNIADAFTQVVAGGERQLVAAISSILRMIASVV